jgi:1,4-alpha-glucan branching enzyme
VEAIRRKKDRGAALPSSAPGGAGAGASSSARAGARATAAAGPGPAALDSRFRPLSLQHGRASPRASPARRASRRRRRSLRRLGAQRPLRLRRRQLQRLERRRTPDGAARQHRRLGALHPRPGPRTSTTSSPSRSPTAGASSAAIPSRASLQNDINRTPIFTETYYEFHHPRVALADKFGGALNVYEVHPLSWRFKDGRPLSYRELIDELVPYVKYMEYTHVELMGILEHPYVPSWGYQVIGFYAPTSRLGSPTDFKRLVDAFHREGIGVILDEVLVHFPKDATGLAVYDNDSHLFECPIPDRRHTPWGTAYFDFARNEVKSFLISSLFHWIEEYYIDGFRFDAAGQFHYYEFPTEEKYRAFLQKHGNCHNPEGFRFMQSMNWAVKEEHPETILIAEDSTIASGVTRPVDHGGHGFDYKWDLGCTSHMLKFFRAPYARRGEVYGDLTYPLLYHHTENFLLPLGHDEVVHMKRSMVNKTEDLSDFEKFANARVLYLLQFGYPQKKLLFMGQEFGQKSEWNAEGPLPWESTWDPMHRSLQWFVKRLNEVYKYIPAMHEGDNIANGFEWIECQNHGT